MNVSLILVLFRSGFPEAAELFPRTQFRKVLNQKRAPEKPSVKVVS